MWSEQWTITMEEHYELVFGPTAPRIEAPEPSLAAEIEEDRTGSSGRGSTYRDCNRYIRRRWLHQFYCTWRRLQTNLPHSHSSNQRSHECHYFSTSGVNVTGNTGNVSFMGYITASNIGVLEVEASGECRVNGLSTPLTRLFRTSQTWWWLHVHRLSHEVYQKRKL